jgi:hypothetical protein
MSTNVFRKANKKTCKRDVRMSSMGGIMHTIMSEFELEKTQCYRNEHF